MIVQKLPIFGVWSSVTHLAKSPWKESPTTYLLVLEVTNCMTPFSSHLTPYSRASRKQLIIVTNEDYVPIIGSSSTQLQQSLSLHNVLHVSNLANNLIYIHRLAQDYNNILSFLLCLLVPCIWEEDFDC
ncbi:hypothetical protein CR513_26148, partial [Mucuna pruriens]